MRAFAAAVGFLTRIPTDHILHHDLDDLGRSTPYFPFVGLLVGSVGALVFSAASFIWPVTLAIIVSVASTVLLTGAFHEDALADSFDGFGGGWTADQVLTIMKDSRVGSYALIGVMLVVTAKITALLAIATDAVESGRADFFGTANVARALIAAHVLGRWSSVPLMRYNSYVRAPSATERPGVAQPLVDFVTTTHLVVATLAAIAIVSVTLGARSLVVWSVCIVVTGIAGWYFRKRIGGITGDALGATNQLVELTVYLVLAAHLRA